MGGGEAARGVGGGQQLQHCGHVPHSLPRPSRVDLHAWPRPPGPGSPLSHLQGPVPGIGLLPYFPIVRGAAPAGDGGMCVCISRRGLWTGLRQHKPARLGRGPGCVRGG